LNVEKVVAEEQTRLNFGSKGVLRIPVGLEGPDFEKKKWRGGMGG
jgi:hypothetical protein